MVERPENSTELLTTGAAVLALVAACTGNLFLLTRVWRPFTGGVRVWAPRLARPFGMLEIALSVCCVLIVALPAAWSAGFAPVADPARSAPSPTLVAVLLPAVMLYAVWGAAAVSCARFRGCRLRDVFLNWIPAQRPLIHGVTLGAAMVAPVLVVSVLSFELCGWIGLGDAPQDVFALLTAPGNGIALRVAVIGLAVIAAPVAEEVLFRGVLFPALLAHSGSFARALVLQALFFGAIHAHLPTFLPLGVAGACFALGYAVTGSLVTPILMHMIFNATSIVFFFAAVE
ncbi:MAG: CPBP family intramembrane metalloprotease [Lentisphaerae bacterium]|nr:CPBP family intramembrane metalloprotease [Lentisphaerota bacterium]